MNVESRIRNQGNAKRGNATETIAEIWLKQNGFACIERIERSWIPKWKGGKIVGSIPNKKVSGDITAIDPHTGRHVHVEVKSRKADVLRWSDFEGHQIEALNRKVEAKALCLVMWVKSPAEIQVYEWPVDGFGPGRSLNWEE